MSNTCKCEHTSKLQIKILHESQTLHTSSIKLQISHRQTIAHFLFAYVHIEKDIQFAKSHTKFSLIEAHKDLVLVRKLECQPRETKATNEFPIEGSDISDQAIGQSSHHRIRRKRYFIFNMNKVDPSVTKPENRTNMTKMQLIMLTTR